MQTPKVFIETLKCSVLTAQRPLTECLYKALTALQLNKLEHINTDLFMHAIQVHQMFKFFFETADDNLAHFLH